MTSRCLVDHLLPALFRHLHSLESFELHDTHGAPTGTEYSTLFDNQAPAMLSRVAFHGCSNFTGASALMKLFHSEVKFTFDSFTLDRRTMNRFTRNAWLLDSSGIGADRSLLLSSVCENFF